MSWSTCKYCGEKIVWALMPAGNYLPMDPEGSGFHECVPFGRHDYRTTTAELETSEWTVGFHPAGILVGQIVEGSPAESAGLHTGDIIIKANEQEIRDMPEFYEIRNSVRPGEELQLTLKRGKRTVELTVRRPGTNQAF